MDLTSLTIKKVHEGLKAKEFSSTELCGAFFDKIKKDDKKIHAYLNLTEELAKKQAKETDEKISAGGEIGILEGAPCAIKDNILIAGEKCTAGSKILENYVAVYDAGVIKKLKKQNSIFLGKANLDEFAMGSSTENSAFGPTRNPRDLERVAGGSSGGSAAAVAADECVFALGSDTGGSIRLPASFCGAVGLKPTYGAVSRAGVIAMASSLDQVGPLAKNVEDCRTVFDAIKGKDEKDSTGAIMNHESGIMNHELRNRIHDSKFKVQNLRIGLPKEYFAKGLDKGVEKSVRNAISKMADAGAEIKEISLPHAKYALACYYIIMPCEVSANLARYDGIRYGASAIRDSQDAVSDLLNVYLKSRGQNFGAEAKRRIMLGTFALSAGYYDAYYLKAQQVRTKIIEDFKKAFEKVDLIFSPVSPTTAFKIGEKIDDPLQMYLSDIYTISVNLAGLPALSMPCGSAQLTQSPAERGGNIEDLPVGLQIIGPKFSEDLIFDAAGQVESLLK